MTLLRNEVRRWTEADEPEITYFLPWNFTEEETVEELWLRKSLLMILHSSLYTLLSKMWQLELLWGRTKKQEVNNIMLSITVCTCGSLYQLWRPERKIFDILMYRGVKLSCRHSHQIWHKNMIGIAVQQNICIFKTHLSRNLNFKRFCTSWGKWCMRTSVS